MIPHYAVVNSDGDLEFDFPAQQRAFCKRLGVGRCVDVEIREHRAKRSDRQNRAMWALLHEWCDKADQGWRPDDLKDAVMGVVFGTVEVTQPLTGEIVKVPAKARTSQLNVTEFIKVIDAILELAAEHDGICLLAPDEYRRAKEAAAKQVERDQRKRDRGKAA